MPNFLQQITFEGVDNVTKTVNSIMSSIGELDLLSAKLDAQFSNVSRSGTILASKLKYIGLAAAGVATSAFWLSYRTSDAAESLLNLSQKTGIQVEQLQKLNYIADQANVGSESLANGFKFLNRSIADASSTTDSQASAAFQALGVNLKDAQGNLKTTEQVFYDLSDAFNKGTDGPQKVNAAITLLGRAGTELIPVLNKGSESLRKQGDAFVKYGNLIDKNGLQAIEGFNDTVDNALLAIKSLGSVMAQALIPILNPLVEEFGNWVSSNRELIRSKLDQWLINIRDGFNSILPKLEDFGAKLVKVWNFIGGFEGILKGLVAFIASDLVIAFANFATSIVLLGKILAVTPIGKFITLLSLAGLAVYELNKAFPNLAQTVVGTIDIMYEKFKSFFSWLWDGIKKILAGLHLIDEEKNKQEGKRKGTLTTVVDPTTGKAHTTYNADGGTDFGSIGSIPTGKESIGSPIDNGPFAQLLASLNSLNNNEQSPMQINVKLDTENKVSYVDIDAPLTANVSVNSGPMINY